MEWRSEKRMTRSLSSQSKTPSASQQWKNQLLQSQLKSQQARKRFQLVSEYNSASGSYGGNWEHYAKSSWWGQVQPPTITTSAGTKLHINWNPKITSPVEILSGWLFADLCKRFTLVLVEWKRISFGKLAEELKIPESAVLSLTTLMDFDTDGHDVMLPEEHPLAC